MRPVERQERDDYQLGRLLDEQDELDWQKQRNIDIDAVAAESAAMHRADAQAAFRVFKNREAELIEQAKRQAFEAWRYERDAS